MPADMGTTYHCIKLTSLPESSTILSGVVWGLRFGLKKRRQIKKRSGSDDSPLPPNRSWLWSRPILSSDPDRDFSVGRDQLVEISEACGFWPPTKASGRCRNTNWNNIWLCARTGPDLGRNKASSAYLVILAVKKCLGFGFLTHNTKTLRHNVMRRNSG